MKPEVSVIIPAYNTETYIAQSIESVLLQTLNNIEIIVVDDASTDKTAEVVKSFDDRRINLLINETNLGASGARNRALRAAQGEWVAVLDSDDWYAPQRLEKLLQVAHSKDADIVADDLYLIEDRESLPWSTLIGESGANIDYIKVIDPVYFVETDVYGKQGLHLGLSKPLFKQNFLIQNGIQYDEELDIAEDFWLDLKCLIDGARFVLLPEPYYFYRSRPGSLVSSSPRKNLEKSCHKIEKFIREEDAIHSYPNLFRALSKSFTVFKRNLAYYRVVEPLKQKKWLFALIQMVYNPYFFIHVLFQIPGIIDRRIQYYFLGNKSALKLLYHAKKKPGKTKINKSIN